MNIFKNASSIRPTVALLPGEIFFVQRIELPEGMSDADVFSFVQITLEESSPFPIEQLAWGFLQDPNSKWVLFYSTTLERLKQYRPESLANCYHVFPSFVSPCMQVWEEPTALCLLQGNTLSTLYFEANDPLPKYVLNRAIVPHPDRSIFEQAFELRERMLSEFKALNPTYEAGILFGTEVTVDKAGDIEFHHKHYRDLSPEGGQIVEPTTLERSRARWNADIRETAFKKSENKKRLTNRRLQLGLYAAGIVLLCIILAHAFRYGAVYYNYRLNTTLLAQAPHVKKIEEDASLLDHLNQLAEKEFLPFAMLGVLNVTRPSGVYFENIKADPMTGFEAHGVSSSVSQVNAYVTSLEQAEVIRDVKLSDIQTRRGKVNFTLLVDFDFTTLPAAELQAVAQPIETSTPSDPQSTNPNAAQKHEPVIQSKNESSTQSNTQPLSPSVTVPKAQPVQPQATTQSNTQLQSHTPSTQSATGSQAQASILSSAPVNTPSVSQSPTQPQVQIGASAQTQTRARTLSLFDTSSPLNRNTQPITEEDLSE